MRERKKELELFSKVAIVAHRVLQAARALLYEEQTLATSFEVFALPSSSTKPLLLLCIFFELKAVFINGHQITFFVK